LFVVGSTQAPPQTIWLPLQTVKHAPLKQVWPAAHFAPAVLGFAELEQAPDAPQ